MHAHHASVRRLQWVLGLLLGGAGIEISVGILFANSRSLHGDGWHMAFDAGGTLVALITSLLAERQTDERSIRRLEAQGSAMIAFLLVPAALTIGIQGIERWLRPQPVREDWMMLTAAFGLALNIGCFCLTHSVRTLRHIRATRMHFVGDTGNSLAVILGGGLIAWTGWQQLDGLIALGISGFLGFQAQHFWRDARRTIRRIDDHQGVKR